MAGCNASAMELTVLGHHLHLHDLRFLVELERCEIGLGEPPVFRP